MNTWNNASAGDQELFRILSNLYRNNKKLLFILLNPDAPCLQSSSYEIKKYSGVLSSGEALLLRIGLDIWDSSGGIHFNELYQTLSPQNFQNVILTLAALRNPSGNITLF